MQKPIPYIYVIILAFFVSCVSSKKKTHETITTVYTTEVVLDQETPKDTISQVPIFKKATIEAAPNLVIDPEGAIGQIPKDNKKQISPEEKEKIKQIMRERIKAQQKKN